MSKKNFENWGTLSFYLPQLEHGLINDTPITTEMPKPSRQGESYEQFTPIEANKLRIKQVFEHLSDLCNSTVAYLEERIVCPPLIDLIRKSFDKWDLECLKSLIEFSKNSGRNYGSEKKNC